MHPFVLEKKGDGTFKIRLLGWDLNEFTNVNLGEIHLRKKASMQVEAKTMYEQTITSITNFHKIHHNFELWKNQHFSPYIIYIY
jgi:hypothetical protein